MQEQKISNGVMTGKDQRKKNKNSFLSAFLKTISPVLTDLQLKFVIFS